MTHSRSLIVLVSILMGLVPSVRGAAAAPRPNFLFIYTDDQRYDALSVVQEEQGERGRFPWFKTPNMDRLAAEGVRFRNAFVVNSLCAPSRAVNLTGQYNHQNGIASNFRAFPTNNVTHATLLRAAGYTTVYVGKWHMDSQRERPGFDHHYSFVGHARYVDPPIIRDGNEEATKGWVDDLTTDYVVNFLEQQKGGTKPWSVVLGFKSPHGPFEPPARAKDRFTGEKARPVPNLHTPAIYNGKAGKPVAVAGESVPVNLDYFRCISAVDDCLGRVLEALDRTGAASNTLVIYTSDNGFYLGEHGLGDKRSAYDESLRVPFLVRYPALGAAARGKVVDEMVLNLDLAQTLLDFAGVPAPSQMQGRSWRPLLTTRPEKWRQSWFYEYFAEKQKSSRVPDITAVRTTDAKLIRYMGHDEWTELFDLKNDPYELRNLFNDPAHAGLRAQLEAELARLAGETGYRVPEYTDRPEWWGKPGGPDWKPETQSALRLEFLGVLDGKRAVDSSGLNNHGTVSGIEVVPAPGGGKAFRFDGTGYIEVPKQPSLDPAEKAWTVEVTLKPDKQDGMVLARGGKSQGYALWLQNRKPCFTVVAGGKPITATAKDPLEDWSTVTAMIKADRTIAVYVNGVLAGTKPIPEFIAQDPNDGMQIGADLGSPVVQPDLPRFTGAIRSVRITSGEKLPESRR